MISPYYMRKPDEEAPDEKLKMPEFPYKKLLPAVTLLTGFALGYLFFKGDDTPKPSTAQARSVSYRKLSDADIKNYISADHVVRCVYRNYLNSDGVEDVAVVHSKQWTASEPQPSEVTLLLSSGDGYEKLSSANIYGMPEIPGSAEAGVISINGKKYLWMSFIGLEGGNHPSKFTKVFDISNHSLREVGSIRGRTKIYNNGIIVSTVSDYDDQISLPARWRMVRVYNFDGNTYRVTNEFVQPPEVEETVTRISSQIRSDASEPEKLNAIYDEIARLDPLYIPLVAADLDKYTKNIFDIALMNSTITSNQLAFVSNPALYFAGSIIANLPRTIEEYKAQKELRESPYLKTPSWDATNGQSGLMENPYYRPPKQNDQQSLEPFGDRIERDFRSGVDRIREEVGRGIDRTREEAGRSMDNARKSAGEFLQSIQKSFQQGGKKRDN